MDWNALTAISSLIMSAAVIVSLVLIFLQLLELQRSTHAQSFFAAVDRLQNEGLRRDRATVFRLKGKPLDLWSSEEIEAAERVCHNYDVIGIMARNKMLRTRIIADSWGDSLRRLWPILEPLVHRYRCERKSAEFWDDFPWLADKAEKLGKARKRRHSIPVCG